MQSSQNFPSTSGRTRKEIVSSLKKSVLASLRLEYFSKKSYNFPKTPPHIKSVHILNTTSPSFQSPNIINKESTSQAFCFSRITRFENTIYEKFKSN